MRTTHETAAPAAGAEDVSGGTSSGTLRGKFMNLHPMNGDDVALGR